MCCESLRRSLSTPTNFFEIVFKKITFLILIISLPKENIYESCLTSHSLQFCDYLGLAEDDYITTDSAAVTDTGHQSQDSKSLHIWYGCVQCLGLYYLFPKACGLLD